MLEKEAEKKKHSSGSAGCQKAIGSSYFTKKYKELRLSNVVENLAISNPGSKATPSNTSLG
jgi:hypothetical protein